MEPSHAEYLYSLSIQDIINCEPWEHHHQTLTSAATDNDTREEGELEVENTSGIAAFKDIQFNPEVKTVLDVGGGKFDANQRYLKSARDIDLLVWDPYNRSPNENGLVEVQIRKEKVDAATSMSVLNVIREIKTRLTHIATLKAALKPFALAYFKIWPGEGALKETGFASQTKCSYQANAPAYRFKPEIEIIFGKGNVALHPLVPNLIVAMNRPDQYFFPATIFEMLGESQWFERKQKEIGFSLLSYRLCSRTLALKRYSLFNETNRVNEESTSTSARATHLALRA